MGDNGLDITDQLDDKNDNSDSRYADTVDELEKLMLRLSSVFDTFRDPNGGKDHVSENEAIFGLGPGDLRAPCVLVCAMRSLAIVFTIVQSFSLSLLFFPLRLLLLTHFGESPMCEIIFHPIFWHN